jgi:tetratricopeptide (TPR) repeat protein
MERLHILFTVAILMGAAFFTPAQAQCTNWNEIDQKDAAEEAHVLYRQFFKQEDFEKAFPYWEKAYALAPAADGQRPFHYMDGRDMYMAKYKAETDKAKKDEYRDIILRLYDEEIKCYGNDATLLSLKAFDMHYNFNMPYVTQLETLNKAIDVGGDETSYVVMDPFARVAVYQFTKEKMTAEEARRINLRLNEIADINIEKNNDYSAYYKQAKDAMNGIFREIEFKIFDCEYFKTKYKPAFTENPDDYELIKRMFNRLKAQGCDESDPFVAELKMTYDSIVTIVNAEKLAVFYTENPGAHAKDLYEKGEYSDAIAKYKEAIEKEENKPEGTDNNKLADYYFAIASIQGRKLKSYNSARTYARKAASYREGWGQPYMLIGDLYASTSSSCGKEAWDKQLAVLAAIDKYAYARSIDDAVAEEANSKISKYSGFKPSKEEGFMRKVKEGSKAKVKCWIGETVSVRYQ